MPRPRTSVVRGAAPGRRRAGVRQCARRRFVCRRGAARRYLRPARRHAASRPAQGGGVRARRPAVGTRCSERVAAGQRAASGVRERRASGTGDARLHRGAHRGRGTHRRGVRDVVARRHHPAPVVRARAGPPLALSARAAVRARPCRAVDSSLGHVGPAVGAQRLGLVTHAQMVAALVEAVEHPPDESSSEPRVWEVPRIARAYTAMQGVR